MSSSVSKPKSVKSSSSSIPKGATITNKVSYMPSYSENPYNILPASYSPPKVDRNIKTTSSNKEKSVSASDVVAGTKDYLKQYSKYTDAIFFGGLPLSNAAINTGSALFPAEAAEKAGQWVGTSTYKLAENVPEANAYLSQYGWDIPLKTQTTNKYTYPNIKFPDINIPSIPSVSNFTDGMTSKFNDTIDSAKNYGLALLVGAVAVLLFSRR
jgi:hypothetical protein